jgi:hypothetical protein
MSNFIVGPTGTISLAGRAINYELLQSIQFWRLSSLDAEMKTILDRLEQSTNRVNELLHLADELEARVTSNPDSDEILRVESTNDATRLNDLRRLQGYVETAIQWRTEKDIDPDTRMDLSMLHDGIPLIQDVHYKLNGTRKELTAVGLEKVQAVLGLNGELAALGPSSGEVSYYSGSTEYRLRQYRENELLDKQRQIGDEINRLERDFISNSVLSGSGVDLTLGTVMPDGNIRIKNSDLQTWVEDVRAAAHQIGTSFTEKETEEMTALQKKQEEVIALMMSFNKNWFEGQQSIIAGMRS